MPGFINKTIISVIAAMLLAVAAGCAFRVLPEGNHAALGPRGDLQRNDAVHGAAMDGGADSLFLSADRARSSQPVLRHEIATT